MEITPDVNGNPSPVVSEDLKPQEQLPVAPVVTTEPTVTPPKGSQTPSENLYAALAEERRLRKEAEDKLESINTTIPSDDVYSDEGRLLAERIAKLEAREKAIEEQRENELVIAKFPALKEVTEEFNEFQKDYPRHKLENVAKIFLAEKGLLEPVRKGLESPTGGQRTPMTSEMTPEDIKNLRETNYKKYKDLLGKGLINI